MNISEVKYLETPTQLPEVALLRAARNLLTDPMRWTQGSFARDWRDLAVTPAHSGAVKWCALGALRVLNERADETHMKAMYCLQQATSNTRNETKSIIVFNDNGKTRHKDVLALYDQAIAIAESGVCDYDL